MSKKTAKYQDSKREITKYNDLPKPKRDSRGYWLPGQTGNPAGRPKKNIELERAVLEILEAENDEGVQQGIHGLLQLATTARSEITRLGAWRTLFEYGYGTPRKRAEIIGDSGPSEGRVITLKLVDDKPGDDETE